VPNIDIGWRIAASAQNIQDVFSEIGALVFSD
jgi:hypothetical protein